MKFRTLILLTIIQLATLAVYTQTTEFTYQGSLKDGSFAASGTYDFEFKLYDQVSAGTQQGSTVQRPTVAVTNGVFSVSLDFGNGSFPGADRYLEIAVRMSGGGAFTPLNPRQKINSAPYSVKSLNSTNADTAVNSTQLGGLPASQFVVTSDPRMTDSRTPTAGSTNYIQNQDAAPQASSNFNIDGTGSASFINANAQFNLSNLRILSAPTSNLFVGHLAGQNNTSGDTNSFFGREAGLSNATGSQNSYFGWTAGRASTGNANSFFGYATGQRTTSGTSNSFFGHAAGLFNTIGGNNSFFGQGAGQTNTVGNLNTFIGQGAGFANVGGSNNAFVGQAAGYNNTSGAGNSFLGRGAGFANTDGSNNTFIGLNAGSANTSASNNTFVGTGSGQLNTSGNSNSYFGVFAGFYNTSGLDNSFFGKSAGQDNSIGSNNAFFGKSAGEKNTEGIDNSFVGALAGFTNTFGSFNTFSGRSAGQGNTTGNDNSFFGTNAGLSNSTGGANSFVGSGTGRNNTTAFENSFFGRDAGRDTGTGGANSFVGVNAGRSNTTGNNNSFFGKNAGLANVSGLFNTAIGANANFGAVNLTYATAIGADATVSTINTIVLGRSSGQDQVVVPGPLVANLPAGDGDYIQNRTTPQSADFSVTGNGYIGGNVGVGTTTPQSKLEVNGNVAATGDMSQGIASSGLMKFGLLINADGTIGLCYRPGFAVCGVSVTRPATGFYDITFPYQISNRIFSLTTSLGPGAALENTDILSVRPSATNVLRVRAASFGANSFDVNVSFYLTVF